MFGMVLERLYLQDLQKISGDVEQKICAVGVTNVLTEAPAMLHNYEAFWWVKFVQMWDVVLYVSQYIT
jgi:exportin-2 (importin alpha re-exporter)